MRRKTPFLAGRCLAGCAVGVDDDADGSFSGSVTFTPSNSGASATATQGPGTDASGGSSDSDVGTQAGSGSTGNGACGACDVDEDSNAFTGYGPDQQWRESIFDVSAHTTAAVRLRFLFGSHDGYACYPSGAGWYIDDLEIFEPVACP